MDLDALKAGLNRRLEQPVMPLPDQVVCKLPRSRGLLIRLRKNLWIETALYMLSIPVMVFEAWRIRELSLAIYLLTCAVIMGLLIPFFVGLARRITRFLHSDTTVHEGLKELLDIMKTYKKRYLQFNLIMVPVCLVYAIVLVIAFPGSDTPDLSSDSIQMPGWQIILMFFGALLLLLGSTWMLARWWIHWLYGRFIKDMESELNEVESADE